MCVSDLDEKALKNTSRSPTIRAGERANRTISLVVCAAFIGFFTHSEKALSQSADWQLPSVESGVYTAASRWTPTVFATSQQVQAVSTVKLLRVSEVSEKRMADATIALADFNQAASQEPPQLPSYLNPTEDMPQPP